MASQLSKDPGIEIFSRDPAESVVRFRCLSKNWNNILYSPYFVNQHLPRETHQQSVILKITPYTNSLRIISPPIENSAISLKLSKLFAHEGRLCALSTLRKFMSDNGKIGFRMMKENSWTKLFSIGGNMINCYMYMPLYVSRAPAKSVGKFRCSSNIWNRILSTPYFINLHLSCKTQPQSVILITPYSSLQIINSPIENPAVSRQLVLENEGSAGRWTDVMGSCDGLVLLMNSKKEMVLANPLTREQLKIPKLYFGPNFTCDIISLHGFGYDRSSRDYKILLVTGLVSIDAGFSTSVDLYSVKSAVWRSIHHSPYKFNISETPRGVYANNGSIYWYRSHRNGSNSSNKILAFDLASEGFHEVDSPPDASFGVLRLFAHGGCSCALKWLRKKRGKIDFWMMKENSWSKLFSIGVNMINCYMFMPLYISRDENVLLAATGKSMVMFNKREETIRNFVVDGVPTSSGDDGCSFVGSLVSISGIVSSS